MNEPLRARGLAKAYIAGDGRPIRVLQGCDLETAEGELVAIVGASGVGKSTLLHLLGGLDQADAGEIWVRGEPLHGRTQAERAALRGRHIGFVFQFHHLLPEFTAVENVMMPLLIARERAGDARRRAEAALAELGLSERFEHRPGALSGGEQQRVSIARALVARPAVILADEPTGNLDPSTGEGVFNVLARSVAAHRLTAVLATHNERLARRCGRILQLEGGVLTRTTWDEVQWNAAGPVAGEPAGRTKPGA
jgi:lipoprotein-releasing system ATP-binding protein